MRKLFFIRAGILLAIWIPACVWVFHYAEKELRSKRIESLVLTNGQLSSVQREYVFRKDIALKPGDQILSIAGQKFQYQRIKGWLHMLHHEHYVSVDLLRNGKLLKDKLWIRKYSKRDELVFLFLPILVSLIFLFFSILTPIQKFNLRKTQEAVEVFSLLCFALSLLFLGFFPSVTLGMKYPVFLMIPLVGAMLVHLFLVYPKRKLSKKLRITLLSTVYSAAAALVCLRIHYWFSVHVPWFNFINIFASGLCLIVAMASLGNTLFTSKDFWARRRARLLSIAFLATFISIVSVFISFLWKGPRISLERMLAVSVLFPVAFAFIFSKENVFDLERIFKRGIHQILFLGIAITLGVLVGVSWQQWGADKGRSDWLVWAAIAMAVALFARPVGVWFERFIDSLVSTRVRFPKVDEIFENSSMVEDFLTSLSMHCEKYLNMQSISYRFFKDPTIPWNKENEQVWEHADGRLRRVYERKDSCYYFSSLQRGNISVGEILFSGGDALAFDPVTSISWERICHSIAQCLELLILREFLVSQQSLLAVGRMQALLAHEMKNPLSVIKVCAGLLQSHTDESEESEEILKTIQKEVSRISDGVQNIFNHSGKDEQKEKLDMFQLVERVKESVLTQFPERKIEVKLWIDDHEEPWEENALWMWVEREGLRQSLVNLLINAFEAGSPWVGIEISLQSSQYFRILVKDCGPGIPREVELFKPFVSSKSNGTGLGLSHVKAFVDRHSGRIQVSSVPNEGAQFVLEFSPEFIVQ